MTHSSAQEQIAFGQELLTAFNTTERSPTEEFQEEDLVGIIAIEPENHAADAPTNRKKTLKMPRQFEQSEVKSKVYFVN